MPGTQVVRIEGYSQSALSGIGNEQLRDEKSSCRNAEIDSSRTPLNCHLKPPAGGSLAAAWHRSLEDLDLKFTNRKGVVAFEQMLITSGPEFFASLGWTPGDGLTPELEQFFRESYDWALQQIGVQGSDRNVLAATIHVDETTPHLHISYIPVAESWRRKKYATDPQTGKILRRPSGSPIEAKDDKGKPIWEIVHEPKVSRTEFWKGYGGEQSEIVTGRRNTSYSLLQDSYQEDVGKHWGLDRGEIGSDARHQSHHKQQTKKARQELQALREQSVQVLADTQMQTDAMRQELEQQQISLLHAKDAWENQETTRQEKLRALDGKIVEQQESIQQLEARIGETATAADLAQTSLPQGKRGMGRRISYSEEENLLLRRLARTGLLHKDIEHQYAEERAANQKLRTRMTALSGEMQVLQSSLNDMEVEARRVPELEFELERTKTENTRLQTQLRQKESGSHVLGELIATLAGLLQAVATLIRDRLPAPLRNALHAVPEFIRTQLMHAGIPAAYQAAENIDMEDGISTKLKEHIDSHKERTSESAMKKELAVNRTIRNRNKSFER